jgi:hypothetical protein
MKLKKRKDHQTETGTWIFTNDREYAHKQLRDLLDAAREHTKELKQAQIKKRLSA